MFLAYMEEPGATADGYVVAGGVLVREWDTWPLSILFKPFADFVCNMMYRYYSGFDAPEFEMILPAFDNEEGHPHGLTHLVGRYSSCSCPACTSRRRYA